MTGVLLIYLDDARKDSFDYMPFVRSMMPKATVFTRAYSNFPLCGPARANLMTGQHAHVHGVMQNGSAQPLLDNGDLKYSDMLGARMRSAGFTSGFSGKWGIGAARIPGDPALGGWDVLHQYEAVDAQEHHSAQVWDGTTSERVSGWHHTLQTQVMLDLALTNTDWFGYWPTSTPHWPFSAPPSRPFVWSQIAADAMPPQEGIDWPTWITDLPPASAAEARTIKVQQAKELWDLDLHLRGVWETLVDDGQAADVTVLIASDNGRHIGDHRLLGPATKNTLYEEAARTPMIAWGPGFPQGAMVDVLVGTQDLNATCLGIAGATPTLGNQVGLDLRAIATDPAAHANRPLLLQRRMFDPDTIPDGDAVVTPTRKLMRHETDPVRYEMYDLDTDPGELVNVANNPARLTERNTLAASLDNLLAS